MLVHAVELERRARGIAVGARLRHDAGVREAADLERAALAIAQRLRTLPAGWQRTDLIARLERLDGAHARRMKELAVSAVAAADARAALEVAVRRRTQLERHRARRFERYRLEREADEEAELEEASKVAAQ